MSSHSPLSTASGEHLTASPTPISDFSLPSHHWRQSSVDEFVDEESWAWPTTSSLLSPLAASSHDASAPALSTAVAQPLRQLSWLSSSSSSFDVPLISSSSSTDDSPPAPSSPANSTSTSAFNSSASSPSPPLPVPHVPSPSSVVVADRVKRSHREMDAERRQKEAAAVRRLEELTSADKALARSKRRKGTKGCMKTARRDKVAVLEACVEKMERMEALLEAMSGNPAATKAGARRRAGGPSIEETKLRSLAQHLQGLAELRARRRKEAGLVRAGPGVEATETPSAVQLVPSPIADAIKSLDAHHALYSALFIHPQLAIGLREMATGLILDANDVFLRVTGWKRADLVGRTMSPTRSAMLALPASGPGSSPTLREMTEEEARSRPLVRERAPHEMGCPPQRRYGTREAEAEADDGEEEMGSGRPFVPLPNVRQYPSSVALMRQFVEGRVAHFAAPWRCVFADGLLYEVNCSCFAAKMEEIVEPDGRRWMAPETALILTTADGGIRVDPL